MRHVWIPSALALTGAAWMLAPNSVAQESDAQESLAPASSARAATSDKSVFEAPVRLRAADGYVRTESPGYAAPAMHDLDGDGRKDLVVGQFAGGKIRVYKNTGDGAFAAGEWLMAGGKPAEVPGVW